MSVLTSSVHPAHRMNPGTGYALLDCLINLNSRLEIIRVLLKGKGLKDWKKMEMLCSLYTQHAIQPPGPGEGHSVWDFTRQMGKHWPQPPPIQTRGLCSIPKLPPTSHTSAWEMQELLTTDRNVRRTDNRYQHQFFRVDTKPTQKNSLHGSLFILYRLTKRNVSGLA